jgi:heme exporter protein C
MEPKRLAYVLALILVVDAVATVLAVLRAPYPAFVTLGSPAAYLNIYIHVPVAINSYVLYTGAFIAAILFLVKRREIYDRYVYAFIVVASMYAAYTLISGNLWARESWGAAWNWDPRETGVLLLFIAYLVYFALRASISDPDRAPVVSATYAIAAYSMVPISYAAPRIAASSLHPTKALLQGFMEQPEVRAYFYTKLLLVLLIGLIATKLYVNRDKLGIDGKRALKIGAAIAALLMIGVSAYLAAEYRGGTVTRVYAVFGVPDNATLLVRLGGRYANVSIAEDLSSYVVDGRIALGGHVVKLLGLSDNSAEKVEVLVPSCVIANLVLYSLLISGLAYTILRRKQVEG